jgi:hypothetical protein
LRSTAPLMELAPPPSTAQRIFSLAALTGSIDLRTHSGTWWSSSGSCLAMHVLLITCTPRHSVSHPCRSRTKHSTASCPAASSMPDHAPLPPSHTMQAFIDLFYLLTGRATHRIFSLHTHAQLARLNTPERQTACFGPGTLICSCR